MTTIDTSTASFVVGVLLLIMPTFTWIVLGEARKGAPTLWCIGGMAKGASTMSLSIFPNAQFPALALSVSTFCYAMSFGLRIQALRMDLGKPNASRSIALTLLLCMLIFEYLHRTIGLYVPRAMFVSFVFVIGAVLLAQHAMQIARTENSIMARWIAFAHGSVAFAAFVRLLHLSQEDFSRIGGGFSTDGSASMLIAVAMLLATVIGEFGYVGLFLERAQNRAVQHAKEKTSKEVSEHLGAQIALLERRQSLGELAASIGHELSQPLTAILTNAQLAKRGLQTGRMDGEAAQNLLSKVEQNTQRASKILERIRNFTRSNELRLDIVDMRAICEDVLELMEGDFRNRKVRVEVGPNQGPERVHGDALQLSQVLLNLVRNALDSMAQTDGPHIRIECFKQDGNVRVSVRDWGTGLSDDQRMQVGTPFFSTKPQGLGMGISISRSIARSHGGSLTLENAHDGLGAGAIAVLELPAVAPEAA